MIKQFSADRLSVQLYEDRERMGAAAGRQGVDLMRCLLSSQNRINVMFAAAPSQNEVLRFLRNAGDVDYRSVNAFHMDEYIGLRADASQGFGNFLREHLFAAKPFRSVQYLDGQNPSPEAAAKEYAELLTKNPIDICFMGVGENGHIAFNDPAEAYFQDCELVKLVKLDERCRQQQLTDGCFRVLDEVPTHAMTVTIPALLSARYIICTVPSATKAEAVKNMLCGPISETCPASILRIHPRATLFLEPKSAKLL